MSNDRIPDTVLLETSYDEELGSSQTECSKIPFAMCEFPIGAKGMVSAPPLLDELNSDSDSSLDDSFSSQDFTNAMLSKIHDTGDTNIEVHLHDGDSFYTAIMEQGSSSRSSSPLTKSVRFSTAEIREYNLIVGDHPGCAAGLPLSLDWTYNPNSRIVQLSSDKDSVQKQQRPVRRLNLLQRMKLLKTFYKSSDLWMAERERRDALDKEGMEEKACVLHRVPTKRSLCGDCDDNMLQPQPQQQRQVLQPADACHVMQCLVNAIQ